MIRKPKILYFTKYCRNAGSSRLRSFQYHLFLEKEGVSIEVSPLFSEKYLENLYARKSTLGESVKGYGNRLLKLISLGKYDIIVIEKELFPYLPPFAEYILNFFSKKYIVDYDDAVFHNYDQHPNSILRKILGQKIDAVMKYSSAVIAGNSYLSDRAKKAGAKKTVIIPTVIDLERYPLKIKPEKNKFIVGWIGSKSTFEKHLLPQKNWILKAQEIPGVEFQIVGITEDMNLGSKVSYIPWTEETEVESIRNFDVGIMPLEDSLWEKGKCSYKIIQYFACGIPAIASPVGMNNEVVIPEINGFLASTEQEWLNAIQYFKDNETERRLMGENGREDVENKYAIQVTAKRWLHIILELMNKK